MNMYCKNCYTALDAAKDYRCPKCKRAFVAEDARTYLRRPFPPAWRIVWQVVGTTLLAVGAAYVVAFHQMAAASGH